MYWPVMDTAGMSTIASRVMRRLPLEHGACQGLIRRPIREGWETMPLGSPLEPLPMSASSTSGRKPAVAVDTEGPEVPS